MAPESRKDLSGTQLHGYVIERLIGKGGMGEVYEAYEATLDRKVALKVLPSHLSEDESFTARFLREARSAAKLEHPGICPIYAGGEAQGVYFIAMQYIEGETLGEVLEDHGSLPVEQALLITRRVADALNFAHGQGFIHRDIKPDNIMIDREGRVKVMDFGLARTTRMDARMTQTGMYVGTPEYSSPEQCETLDLDGRSDIYSLGVVLYEMLSGTVPHRAETPYALFTKICTEVPAPIQELSPQLPDSVASIVDRMLAKDREERYGSAGELIVSIDAALRTLNIDSTAETAAVPVPGLSSYTTERLDERAEAVTRRARSYKKKRSLAPVIAIVIAVGVIGIWFALALSSRNGGKPEKIGAAPIVQPEPVTLQEPVKDPEPIKQTVIDRPQPPKEMVGPKEGLAIATLLVCDFVNSNRNPEIEWMRIGVADMFITDLAQCKFLQVVSREELSRLLARLGQTQEEALRDLKLVLGELNAELVLTGSIVKIGSNVRIDIQLLEGSTGRILHTERALEQEEEFLEAIDRLSSSLRTSIAQVVRRSHPDAPAEIFADAGDLTLEEQIFLADAGIDFVKENAPRIATLRRIARELSKTGERNNGAMRKLTENLGKGAPRPEQAPAAAEGVGSAQKRKQRGSKEQKEFSRAKRYGGGKGKEEAEKEGGGAGGASGRTRDETADKSKAKPGKIAAPREPADLGAGEDSEEAEPDEAASADRREQRADKMHGEGAPPPAKPAPLADAAEARRTAGLEKADGSQKLTPAKRNFLAMQLYYRAIAKLEKGEDSPEALADAARDLEESLKYNPSFKRAQQRLEQLLKQAEAKK